MGKSLSSFYAYEKGWLIKFFKPERELKDEDDLILRVKDGKLNYLLNGDSIGEPFSLDNDKINSKNMFLLIHRRNDNSECQLKYIYELD